MLGRILEEIARASTRAPKLTMALAAAASLLAVFSLSRLTLHQDLTDLLPDDVPELRGLAAVRDTLGGMDYAVVLIETDEPDPDLLSRASDALASRLGLRTDLVARVRAGVGEKEKKFFADFFLSRAFLYLEPVDLDRALAILSVDGVRRAVAEDARLLDSPLPNAVQERIVRDPLGLFSDVFLGHFQKNFGAMRFDFRTGHFLSEDGRAAILQVWGKGTPRDVAFSRRFLAHLDRAVEGLKEDLGADATHVRCGCTGGYPVALATQASIKGDMIITATGSFVLVLIIFFLAFRSILVNVTVGVPLALGVLCSFGLVAFFFGFEMTAISAAFGSILVGLGVDFPIHLYNRYAEEKRSGHDAARAVQRAWRWAGPGVVVAGLTTTVAFAALCFAQFRGLLEVGLLVGIGVTVMGGMMIFLLPALLATMEKNLPAPGGFTFGTPVLARLLRYGARPVAFVSAAVVLAAGLHLAIAGPAPFESDFQSLRSPMPEIDRTNRAIEEHFGTNLNPMLLVSPGSSRSEALSRALRASTLLSEMVREHHGSMVGPGAYLPGAEKALRAGARLRAAMNPADVIDRLRKELEAHDFEPEPFEGSLRLLETSLKTSILGLASLADLEAAGYGEVLDPFVSHGPSGWSAVSAVYFPGSIPSEERVGLAAKMEKILSSADDPHTVVTGMDILVWKIRDLVKAEFLPLTSVAAGVVLLLTLFFFRRPLDVVLALTPVSLGFLLTLTLMNLFSVQLNFMNIIVLPMIFGLGVDDGIHFVHRLREGGRSDVFAALHGAGKPIVITSLTTLVGFGSLVLAENPGLRSIGHLALLGISVCMICSVVVLPAFILAVRSNEPPKP